MSTRSVSNVSKKAAGAAAAAVSQSAPVKTSEFTGAENSGKKRKTASTAAAGAGKAKLKAGGLSTAQSGISIFDGEEGSDSDSGSLTVHDVADSARQQEKEARDELVRQMMATKDANPDDDGMMSVAEYQAIQLAGKGLADADASSPFPLIQTTSELLKKSETLITARSDAAIFEGVTKCAVEVPPCGALIFIAKELEVRPASIADGIAVVAKKKLIVNVYQFLHPPDSRTSARLVVRVATNEDAPNNISTVPNTDVLNKSEVTTLTLDNRDHVQQVSPIGWSRMGELLTFRRARVMDDPAWQDSVSPVGLPPGHDGLELGDTGDGSKADSELSAVALAFIAKTRETSLSTGVKPKLMLAGLTTPTADQISFGKPSQHWLTPKSIIEASKRIALKSAKVSKEDSEGALGEYGKSSTKRFCSLGMITSIADAISCAPHKTILTDIHEGWGRIRDRLGVPICTAIFRQALISWDVPIQPGAILYFVALSEHQGASSANIMLRSFDGFTNENLPLDPAFEALWEKMRMPIANVSLDILERALERYMLMLFSMWDVRFILQDEMLRSVDRLFTFLRNNALSSSNSHMVMFTIATISELMKNWEQFRMMCTVVNKEDLSDFIKQWGPSIPELQPSDPIGQMLHKAAFMDSSSLISTLFDNTTLTKGLCGPIAGSVKPTSPSAPVISRKEEKKQASKARNEIRKEAKQAVKANLQSPTTPSPAAANNSKVAVPDACVYFHSTKGCRFGENCLMDHGSPPGKGSQAWNKCTQLQTKVGLTPTPAFKQ